MAGATIVRCISCGTEFPSTNTTELENHSGHDLQNIDPGGNPVEAP